MSDQQKNEISTEDENSTVFEESKINLQNDDSSDDVLAGDRLGVNDDLNQPLGLFSGQEESTIGDSIPFPHLGTQIHETPGNRG